MPQTNSHLTGVGHVIIPVSDQDRALEFYTETLGFEKRMDVLYGEGERWLEVGPPGAETALALVPRMQDNADGVETRVSFGTDDADAVHAELKDRGVDVDAEVMRMGDPVPPMFSFRDQDGNRLLIVEAA